MINANAAARKRGLGVVLLSLAAVACGEEAAPPLPTCLPEPTLRCVADNAIKATDAVIGVEVPIFFKFFGLYVLIDLAVAEEKLGEVMVALAVHRRDQFTEGGGWKRGHAGRAAGRWPPWPGERDRPP